tara:strand:- start:108 stop:353 length:246 start_codon:yes stop_codon:yes gene_type:complete
VLRAHRSTTRSPHSIVLWYATNESTTIRAAEYFPRFNTNKLTVTLGAEPVYRVKEFDQWHERSLAYAIFQRLRDDPAFDIE